MNRRRHIVRCLRLTGSGVLSAVPLTAPQAAAVTAWDAAVPETLLNRPLLMLGILLLILALAAAARARVLNRRLSRSRQVLAARLRELDALNELAGLLATDGDHERLLARVPELLAGAMRDPARIQIQLQLAPAAPAPADANADGGPHRLAILSERGRRHGVLQAVYPADAGAAPPALTHREQGFLRSAGAQLGLYLDRQQARQALSERERHYRTLVENSVAGVALLGPEAQFRYINGRLAEMLGREAEELIRGSIFDVLPAHERESARRRLAERKAMRLVDSRFPVELLRADGQSLWAQVSMSSLYDEQGDLQGSIMVALDVSEQREAARALEAQNAELREAQQRLRLMQDQMVRNERMASLGELAAGVAHEINNPVGYLKSNLGTLERYLKLLDQAVPAEAGDGRLTQARQDLPALLADCHDGLHRVQEIVRGLRGFSHAGEQDAAETDLNEVLESALRLAWNELKYHVRVERDYAGLPPVECRASQLAQVFVNLLVNAAHAIEGEGEVRLSTRLAADGQVEVDIADTGAGIAPELRTRIFEPFYTSKPVGQGTGLGLAVSYGIIEAHGGEIQALETPGGGATFRIRLPLRQHHAPVRAQQGA